MIKRRYKRKQFKPVDYKRFKETRLLSRSLSRQQDFSLVLCISLIKFISKHEINRTNHAQAPPINNLT